MGKKKKDKHLTKGERNPALHAQPDPKGDGVDVWPLVIKDMNDRDTLGKLKYGIPLRAHNGRDALVDAYQEVLDMSVYLRQEIEERNDLKRMISETRGVADSENSSPRELVSKLINRVKEQERQNRILSATVMHYQTHTGYIAGFDDGVEAVLAAVEQVRGDLLTRENIDEIYKVLEKKQSNAKPD
jgi:hypothetical protein